MKQSLVKEGGHIKMTADIQDQEKQEKMKSQIITDEIKQQEQLEETPSKTLTDEIRSDDEPQEEQEKRSLKTLISGMKPTKKKAKKFGVDLLFVFMACTVGAFSIMAVMIPNGLAMGGVTGVARIIQELTGVDYALINYALTLLIVIITWITLGFKEVRKILLMSLMFPAMLFVFEHWIPVELLGEEDVLLASVFCGIFTGISTGIAFSRGYSSGGSDTAAKILRKKFFPYISQTKLMLGINIAVIVGCAFVFGRNIALYAIITQWILGETVEVVLHGFRGRVVQLQIITTKKEELCDFVINELHRGVSVHEVEGGYSGKIRSELRLLCSPREVMSMKKELEEIDPNAFTTVVTVGNVWGKGFTPADED